MKETAEYIEHKGVVTSVRGNTVSINLINTFSCSDCHVKSFCNVSDVDNKMIKINCEKNTRVKKGDKVIVNYEKAMGPRALFLGYLVPFLLVISALIISFELTGDEAISGLLSLSILIPYYLSLYLFRDIIKTNFTFKIKAVNTNSL